MYKIALVLRKTQAPNIFRRTILGAFSSENLNTHLLCSGFFQEKKYKVSSYFASQSFVGAAPAFPCQSVVTTVGVYDKHHWKSQYDDFVKALRGITCFCSKRVTVHQRTVSGRNKWHAKIFISRVDEVPVLAVIGSSNITRNAFDSQKGWNFEGDVIIWDESHKEANDVVSLALEANPADEGVLDREGRRSDVYVANYAQDDPRNTSAAPLPERLNELWREIMDRTTLVPAV